MKVHVGAKEYLRGVQLQEAADAILMPSRSIILFVTDSRIHMKNQVSLQVLRIIGDKYCQYKKTRLVRSPYYEIGSEVS